MSQLTKEQRYTISAMLNTGHTRKEIAEAINKDKSVLSREINRNKNKMGRYSYPYAQEIADIRKERLCKNRKFTVEVEKRIRKYIEMNWSPEQIVGVCMIEGTEMVSHERIYQYIREDKKQGGTLYTHCRYKLKHRKRAVGKHSPIKNRISIDERPKEANGKRFGDFEMDLIVGPRNKDAMLTIVERSTGYSMIRKLPKGKNADGVADAVIDMLLPFKSHIMTITTDNGTEFAEHERIAKKLNTTIYFAHPYSSWEKPLIEYTNGLYRQYIPKKTPFDIYSDHHVLQIQYVINSRPRKKLGFIPPFKLFYRFLQ